MDIILDIGILLITGYILGELAEKISLTRITGYIIAGILLNPDLFGLFDEQIVQNSDPLLKVTLAIITFSIGGTLSWLKVKSAGATMLILVLFESFSAFIFVFIFLFVSLYFILPYSESLPVLIALSLVLASLAAPTDPSATIAVIHESRAKGKVSSAMLEIAAFDDVVGIIIFTLATAFATLLIGEASLNINHILVNLGTGLGGALLCGGLGGLLFYLITRIFKDLSEGALIAISITLVMLVYGISEQLSFESLLSTMVLGAVMVNLKTPYPNLFSIMEDYTDDFVFLIFFTLSGLQLQLSSIQGSLLIILIYIISRMIGKFAGIYAGSHLMKTDEKIKKFTAGGLIPQGGIVIGLALMLASKSAYQELSSTIISIVIGAALIHEIIGPLFSKYSLKKAGEIKTHTRK